jgi:hypothetical protein
VRQNRVLAIRGVRQQLLVAVSKRLLLIAIFHAFLPHRASEKATDNNFQAEHRMFPGELRAQPPAICSDAID